MLKSPDQLIKQYKDLQVELATDTSNGREFETAACILYVSIFERLRRKIERGKAEKYIRDDFYVQDKKRLQFAEDGQSEDAYLCAQIQQAYRIVWTEVLGLELKDNLEARKIKAMFYPIDPQTSPLGTKFIVSAKTGRTKS